MKAYCNVKVKEDYKGDVLFNFPSDEPELVVKAGMTGTVIELIGGEEEEDSQYMVEVGEVVNGTEYSAVIVLKKQDMEFLDPDDENQSWN